MKEEPSNLPASVLARLKNVARNEHLDFNFLLLRYVQERFLSRLAASGCANKFILKGGFLLLAYNINKARPTKDIDFLGVNVSRGRNVLESDIRGIAAIDLKDGVSFLPASVTSEAITEDADYQGVRIRISATIGSARSTIRIDIGFGDIVSPHPVEMDYPTLLSGDTIKVAAYSKETIVAEKFEAIVKLATFNSRMKDFYDIAFLAGEFDFDAALLWEALKNTFDRRQTAFAAAVELLHSDLGSEPPLQRYWDAFQKRTKLHNVRDFKSVFGEIRGFLGPIINSAGQASNLGSTWNRKTRMWQ